LTTVSGVVDPAKAHSRPAERHWKGRPERVRVPYAKAEMRGLEIQSTTGHANPVGSREDHLPRLNTLDDR
jgi:hypothetical protein